MKMFGKKATRPNHMQSRKIYQGLGLAIWLCGSMIAVHAETVLQPIKKLSQAEYNTKIQHYTDQVNGSKSILDAEGTTASAQEQTQAFCTRLNAYHQILKLSQENPELEMANQMQFVAQHYLQQQRDSMQASGLNESAFCTSKDK